MSDFNDYQKVAHSTAVYPTEFDLIYPVLKLAGEAGEVAEKVGKHIRAGDIYLNFDDDMGSGVKNNLTSAQEAELVKELGDVLWYVAEIATLLNVRLSDVASRNTDKLASRSIRGLLIGEGDNR